MARHTIPITNGKGSIELVNGVYNATAIVGGYDASTLDPKKVTIIEGTNDYAFTIRATGVLTLHVTDTGDKTTGVQIIGAKFVRTDSTGTITGTEVTTDHDGNAVFNNVPFAPSGSTEIYYKQITSDGGHTFDETVKSVIMTASTETIEIENPTAPVRNIMLTDASLPNIPITSGQVILEDN